MYFVFNNTNVQGAKCLLKDANSPVLVFLTLALMLQPIIAAKTTWRLTRDLVLMNLYTHEALYEGLKVADQPSILSVHVMSHGMNSPQSCKCWKLNAGTQAYTCVLYTKKYYTRKLRFPL